MVRIEFDGFIKDLSAFFERAKAPTGNTLQLWYEDVRHIPVSALPYLLNEAHTLESWPKNLPNFMKGKYLQYHETHEKSAYAVHPRRLHPGRYAKVDCKKCGGKGVYPFPMDWPVRRDENGVMITRKFTPNALCECTEAAEYGF